MKDQRMTDPRTQIAQQLGLLLIANIEQTAHVETLRGQLEAAQQRLHELSADNAGPSGATPAPDEARGS